MKLVLLSSSLLLLANALVVVQAFVSPSQRQHTQRQVAFLASPTNDNENDSTFACLKLWEQGRSIMTKAVVTSLVMASVWTSTLPNNNDNNNVVVFAKEMASGSGSRVNKDPESLLRYGLPIPNAKEVRKLQNTIEEIKLDVGSKRKAAALDKTKKARTAIKNNNKLTAMCKQKDVCNDILNKMSTATIPLEQSLQDSADAFQGSEQEREALDEAYKYQAELSNYLTDLEQQMVPVGYRTIVPEEYADLPQLQGGRAVVEMTLEKPDKKPFDIEGNLVPKPKLVMIVDGYTSPVTAGNFVDLVNRGFYDKMTIQRSDGFVVQTGDPDGPADGFVGGKPSSSVGAGKNGERLIPLEITVSGDKAPFYESTIEDEGRGGEATVLPFSAYGAMGWARDEYDPNSGSSQFFWLLFDSDLTPAGKNVLDGRYPCFGYVVEGADALSDLKEGDIITSAKVTSGLEYLQQPKE